MATNYYGGLPLFAAARKLQDELLAPSIGELPGDGRLEAETRAVTAMKKAALMVLGTAAQTYGEKLTDQQEVLMAAADILIEVYGAESAVLRAAATSPGSAHEAAAQVLVTDAAARVEMTTRTTLAAMVEGDMLRTLLAALRRIMKVTPVNTVALRRRVADAVIERKAYPF